jgi:L-2-hydroxyglutarate oxidase LhgO
MAVAERADIAVVGGGIVGLATALQLLRSKPDLRLVLLEREPELARHQSSHNSGVVHSGIYYTPGSLKARLCRAGKAELEAYCAERGIPLERIGKLVVALDEAELPRLHDLHERGTANGVDGLELVGPERMREIEPQAAGIQGLWSAGTGIVDYQRVALSFADDVRGLGGVIETGREVRSIAERGDDLVLETSRGPLVTNRAITCGGLRADRLAAMTSDPARERIIPFRGDYYTLKPEARDLVRGLIYPVPDPRFPFLGVHFTRRIDGAVWAGPNAVLAFAREGYRRRDISLPDLLRVIIYPGFLRLAIRYFRTGAAEFRRDLWKPAFVRELQRYLPPLEGNQLTFGPSGVRAQALDPDGTLVDDFRLGGSDRVLHVRNAPSPAATASLAIGRELAGQAIARFGLS